MDAHHRRAYAYTCDFGVEHALIVAVIMGDVGGRPTHIEADDIRVARKFGGLDHAHDTTCGAGEDCILAAELVSCRQSARRHHELQRRTVFAGEGGAEFSRDAVDIALEDRREIGVDHGRVAAADELDERGNLVAHRNLGEACLFASLFDGDLVVRIAPRMHEDDRDGFDASFARLGECGFQ